MKNIFLLFTAFLFINCSSEDGNSAQTNGSPYRFLIVEPSGQNPLYYSYTYNGTTTEGYTAPIPTDPTNNAVGKVIVDVNNDSNPYFTIRNETTITQAIQFEVYKADSNGNYLEQNQDGTMGYIGSENVTIYGLDTGEEVNVYYDYTAQQFLNQ